MKSPLRFSVAALALSLALFSVSAQVQLDWAALYDDPTNDPMVEDEAGLVGIAADGHGNVYVVGRSHGEDRIFRFTLLKYSAEGALLWVRHYAGPGTCRNSPVAMALDAAANLYITGNADCGPDGNSDIEVLTVKYDSEGQFLWAVRYETVFPNRNYARALAVDPEGNAWVTALSSGPPLFHVTIKYDANGTEQWVAQYDALTWALAVDESGNAYAAGLTDAGCAPDPSGEIVCTEEGFLIKFAPDGRQQWVRRYPAMDSRNLRFHAVTVDSQGDALVTGSIWGGANPGTEFVTVKYGSQGRRVWATRHADPTGAIVGGQRITTDPAGNAFVSGQSTTLKYSPAGRLLWEQDEPAYLSDIAADSFGNLYAIGRNFADHEDLIAVKYDPCGNRIWSFQYNTNGTALEIGLSLALSASGHVYLGAIRFPSLSATHLSDFLTLRLSQTDMPLPTISIRAAREVTAERKGHLRPALFIVTREGLGTEPVTVHLNITGTAANGVDYALISNSITIPAGELSISIPVEPMDDTLREGTETVQLQLLSNAMYRLCPDTGATAYILDNDRRQLNSTR